MTQTSDEGHGHEAQGDGLHGSGQHHPGQEEIPPVAAVLAARGIPHRVFRHAGPVRSLEQAAAERGQRPEQVVRSILFRLEAGKYAMVLVAGPGRIDWRALRRHFGQSRLTTASGEEVLAVTGYPIGAVAPFGLRQPVTVLVDERVLAQEEVSMGSGVRGTAVILRTADLMKALGAVEVGRFQA
ncbi:YbaK/EbsC family protein [Litorilinea aerophila]|uniref:YbaK/EbsC family protein n=1 Tax=Litorilinea aerophila TaxID=1204385 RepID=A0A540V8G2_9CHLR|nr:YbaK/EbsC family protein [Litorilinea aerophila]MCC9079027.1 YbaK/EbsC family protein [Litorilinea aerophila]